MRARSQFRRWSDEQGYLMVALLVAITVMAIMMTAAMPAWHTLAQREKEAELVFRGEQIARALGLYQQKFANAPAPSLDALVEQRFLRKKYKDPITNDDFQVLTAGMNLPGRGQAPGGGQQAQSGAQQVTGRTGGAATTTSTQGRGLGVSTAGFGAAAGGVVGVTSKSDQKSLRLYNNQDTYNQWIFMPVARGRVGGDGGRGAGGRGAGGGADGRGGRGAEGGGRGTAPQGSGRGLR